MSFISQATPQGVEAFHKAYLDPLEETLDYLDYLPFVSRLSGIVRLVEGLAQIAFALLRRSQEIPQELDQRLNRRVFEAGLRNSARGVLLFLVPRYLSNLGAFLFDTVRGKWSSSLNSYHFLLTA